MAASPEATMLAWPVLDSAYFDLAQKQIAWYQSEFGQVQQPAERQLYWGTACAAASIALVCAALEAHANFLLDRSARREFRDFPNRLGLSVKAAESLCSNLNVEAKWLVVSLALTGRQLLDPGKAPFQGVCQAITRRNKYFAHAKLRPKKLPGTRQIRPADFEELRELTIPNAQAAIGAARDTVRLIHKELGREPPGWAA